MEPREFANAIANGTHSLYERDRRREAFEVLIGRLGEAQLIYPDLKDANDRAIAQAKHLLNNQL